MNPSKFFKTIEENEDSRKEGVLNNYIEKIVKKYFTDCMEIRQLKDILKDPLIKPCDKQVAVREMSDGILSRIYFYNTKTDVYELMKKGIRHDVVKELINVMDEYGCDILVFPVYKAGNWVAHAMGESDSSVKQPRITIPGDGISITIQDLDTFCKEHK